MPWFAYKGINTAGEIITGKEYGRDSDEISARLVDNGMVVLEIKISTGFSIDLTAWTRISNYELKIFFLNLATLIGAGCSLHASIASLADQTENPRLANILHEVDKDIVAGKTFTEALSKHSSVFSGLFINLIRAGEEGGMLEEVIRRYALYTEKQEATRRKVLGALILPALLMTAALGVTLVLITYVFPTFMQLFKGKENLLPAPTQFVMAISDFFRDHYIFIPTATFATLIGLWVVGKTPMGFRIYCWLQLRVPVIGNLFRKVFVARMSQTLASLLKSGVPALRAIKITQEVIPNIFVREAIEAMLDNVRKGGNYAEPMSQYPRLFPRMVTLMVQVGEQTGELDKMFQKVGDYYDTEVDEAIQVMINMIEPAITVVLGGVVLVIALSMFLPLFDMTKAMR